MKLNIGVVFGGKSVEHEISILSAVMTMSEIDSDNYQIIPIYIDKDNVWYTGLHLKDIMHYRDIALVKRYATKVNLVRKDRTCYLQSMNFPHRNKGVIDIVLPIGHGAFLEDGSLQGYLEMLGIPYVGSKVLTSALGQDKALFKEIMQNNNIPVVPFYAFSKTEFEKDEKRVLKEISNFSYPLYVKPAHLGSSIGITRLENEKSLKKAIKSALELDDKIIIEEEVANLKEVSISVLGNCEKQVLSKIDEINCNAEFYNFTEKYLKTNSKGNKEKLVKPIVSKEMIDDLGSYAKKIFTKIEASGVVRIDFFIDMKKQKIYVNEVNTIPGNLACYLWNETKKPTKELINDLVAIAVSEYKRKNSLILAFKGNLLEGYDRVKGKKLNKKNDNN